MRNVFTDAGLITREIIVGEREGRKTYAMVSESIYKTNLGDLWEAVTVKERLARWFAPIEGDLRLGGRYRVENNASGTITHCDEERGFQLTWEFADDVSWVKTELSSLEPERSKLRLEHLALAEGEHFRIYGPGATGVGWDLALVALGAHLRTGQKISENALLPTPEGKEFIVLSAKAWAQATALAGFDREWSYAAAKKTEKFFTGEEPHECRLPDSE